MTKEQMRIIELMTAAGHRQRMAEKAVNREQARLRKLSSELQKTGFVTGNYKMLSPGVHPVHISLYDNGIVVKPLDFKDGGK